MNKKFIELNRENKTENEINGELNINSGTGSTRAGGKLKVNLGF